MLANCEVFAMKKETVKTLLFVYGQLGNHLVDEKAKELFVACYENDVEAPTWLTDKIINILKKQVKKYKTDRPNDPNRAAQDLYKESCDIHFMWEVDALIKQGVSQEDAVERVRPGVDARQYRRLKERYGDFPPEPLF